MSSGKLENWVDLALQNVILLLGFKVLKIENFYVYTPKSQKSEGNKIYIYMAFWLLWLFKYMHTELLVLHSNFLDRFFTKKLKKPKSHRNENVKNQKATEAKKPQKPKSENMKTSLIVNLLRKLKKPKSHRNQKAKKLTIEKVVFLGQKFIK